MPLVIDGIAYSVLPHHLTPFVCVAEARQHGIVGMNEIDGNRFTLFRNHAPGEPHLVIDGDRYAILSTDYRNYPIWFRISSIPSFENRLEYRTAVCGWKALSVFDDVQLVVPEQFLERFRVPW